MEMNELYEIVNDFSKIKDLAFEKKSLLVTETPSFYELNGIFNFQVKFGVWKTIKFKLLFSKKSDNPVTDLKIKFPLDHHTRHYILKFKLREYILNLFKDKLDKYEDY